MWKPAIGHASIQAIGGKQLDSSFLLCGGYSSIESYLNSEWLESVGVSCAFAGMRACIHVCERMGGKERGRVDKE